MNDSTKEFKKGDMVMYQLSEHGILKLGSIRSKNKCRQWKKGAWIVKDDATGALQVAYKVKRATEKNLNAHKKKPKKMPVSRFDSARTPFSSSAGGTYEREYPSMFAKAVKKQEEPEDESPDVGKHSASMIEREVKKAKKEGE